MKKDKMNRSNGKFESKMLSKVPEESRTDVIIHYFNKFKAFLSRVN
ncbi:hypothetical protein ACQKIC_10950 [Peribacillus sp. NPDC046944]